MEPEAGTGAVPAAGLLAGKVVLVTGGASGIGRAICIAAARHGAATVIVADLTREPKEGGTLVEEAVAAAGARCLFEPTDVTHKAAIERAVALGDRFGGLDVMVCNAGIAVPGDGIDLAEVDFRRLIDVNVNGTYFSAQSAARNMRAHGKHGSIVIIASMGGIRGAAVTVAYSLSKGGARLLAASLADALGPHGIRVNAVCPGVIETSLSDSNPAVADAIAAFAKRTPLRRAGQPAEVASTVVWLASDMASYVTGASIVVDGGLTAVL